MHCGKFDVFVHMPDGIVLCCVQWRAAGEFSPQRMVLRLSACLWETQHDATESSLYFKVLGVLDFEVMSSLFYVILLVLSKKINKKISIAPH